MKKLDTRGVAHEVMLIAFVVIFAIAGVGYLVASHADNACLPTSGATDPLSGYTVCTPTDPGTTDPVSYDPEPSAPDVPIPDDTADNPAPDTTPATTTTPAPAQLTNAKCVVTGVPSKPRHLQILHPVITITNLGPGTLKAQGALGLRTFNAQGKLVVNNGAPFVVTNLVPNKHSRARLAQYVVGYRTTSKTLGSFSMVSQSKSHFVCSARFTYPARPVKHHH